MNADISRFCGSGRLIRLERAERPSPYARTADRDEGWRARVLLPHGQSGCLRGMIPVAQEVPMRLAAAFLCLFVAGGAAADEVQLANGGRVHGVIVERTPAHVVVEVGPGRITLPADQVLGIRQGATALAEFKRRAERLSEQDLEGWLALGRWARERDLLTQAAEAFEHVVRIQPDNAEAQTALGHVFHAGRWVTPEEAYRGQGLVFFEGRWMTPAERGDLVRMETERALAAQARAEAEARAREAEARARAAEAEAARAEADAASADGGIPLTWAYWGGGGGACPIQRGGRAGASSGSSRSGSHPGSGHQAGGGRTSRARPGGSAPRTTRTPASWAPRRSQRD